MPAEIGVDAQISAGLFIEIGKSRRPGAPAYPLCGMIDRLLHRARVTRNKMRKIEISVSLPVGREVIAGAEGSSILLVSHVRTMVVSPRILPGHVRPEFASPVLVAGLGRKGTVASRPEDEVKVISVREFLLSDDIDRAAHGIRAIKQGRRTAGNLDPLGQEILIRVRESMAIDSAVPRVAVNEDEHAASTARKTADADVTRSAVGYAVSQHAPGGEHEPGNFLHEPRKHAEVMVHGKRSRAQDVDGLGHIAFFRPGQGVSHDCRGKGVYRSNLHSGLYRRVHGIGLYR